jgi:hypothetical protein
MIITIAFILAWVALIWVASGIMEYVFCLFANNEIPKAIATLVLFFGAVGHWGVITGEFFKKHGLNPSFSISIG